MAQINAVETNHLTKCFPESKGWRGLLRRTYGPPAVDGVTLRVPQGELFGLVGPNGAGKTTLIKMLSTLILPSSGTALVNGYDLQDARRIKGTVGLVTSDERSFFWRLTGRQNLSFFAALNHIARDEIDQRVMDVMGLMGLWEVTSKPFQTYSTGMRQRLSIARALLSDPRLLFLDEPTKGLDPESSRHLKDLISQLSRSEGVTVLLTSHNLAEVQEICDTVAIMQQGRIIACGSMTELSRVVPYQVSYEVQVRGFPSAYAVEQVLSWVPGLKVDPIETDTHLLRFHPLPEESFLNRVISSIQGGGGIIHEVTHKQASLDTIFSQVTQHAPLEVVPGRESKGHPPHNGADILPQVKVQPVRDFLKVVPAFLRRDFQLERSYRLAFFLQIFEVFFSVAVFHFIAQLFGAAANPYLKSYGGDYFSFVLVGIAFSGYFGVGLSSFSNSIRQAQTTGTLEAMLSTPTGFSAIIASSSLWSYLMTTFRVLIYLLVGTLFLDVDLKISNLGPAFLILVLTVISFSSLGIIAASFIMVLKRGNPVTWIFGTVSTLLGGVYYPVSIMPVWLQTFSYLLPVTYALRGMRLALLQGVSFAALAPEILVLSLFCVVLVPVGLFAFRFAVNKARADGTLTHY